MIISLKDKTALVCGSSQGIGKAIALEFANSGASVVLASRNESLLKKVLSQLNTNHGQEHTYIQADFDDPISFINKLSYFLESRKHIDILVNNSGGPAPGKISESSIEDLESAFRQHVLTSQLLTQKLIPGMRKNNFGRIINIISIGLKQPIDNLGISNTIRGAMGSWAKILSREIAPFGITVNNILPGHTSTPRLMSLFENNAKIQGISTEDAANATKSQIPAGRFADPNELAFAATFLASDKAAFINGINMPVDGGYLKTL